MRISRLFTLAAIILAAAINAGAQTAVATDDGSDIFEQDFNINIATPKVGKSQHDAIYAHMQAQAQLIYRALEKVAGKPLRDKGLDVETERRDEVVVVTIPTDLLFLPNDSVLLTKADGLLRPFIRYAEQPDIYKLVMAVHCDNTGKPSYQETLTTGRVVALYDWFERNAKDLDMVIGYPMGSSHPIYELNDSRQHRAANRRLEIYIIPNNGMIRLAKERKLHP